MTPDCLRKPARILRLLDDIVSGAAEDAGETLAYQDLVVGYHHARSCHGPR